MSGYFHFSTFLPIHQSSHDAVQQGASSGKHSIATWTQYKKRKPSQIWGVMGWGVGGGGGVGREREEKKRGSNWFWIPPSTSRSYHGKDSGGESDTELGVVVVKWPQVCKVIRSVGGGGGAQVYKVMGSVGVGGAQVYKVVGSVCGGGREGGPQVYKVIRWWDQLGGGGGRKFIRWYDQFVLSSLSLSSTSYHGQVYLKCVWCHPS